MKDRIILAVVCVLAVTPPAVAVTSTQESRDERSLVRLGELSESFAALSERVSPAVVQVLATGYGTPAQGESGGGVLTRRQVGGSGVIVDPEGYIVTNAHVVDAAGRIQVQLAVPSETADPGRSILRARGRIVGASLVGIDRETDIAVLKIAERGLAALLLADSDELRMGQIVFAFGSPLGLESSVTMGVVSAVARQLRPEDPMIYIQTDAPINPGNSGGPLVDPQGRVVGINTFIISQSGGNEGIGFAAPSNIVRNVYEQIKANGYVRRGEIGVHAQTITSTIADGLGLERDWGVVLGDVYPGGPADRAGLQIGDIVLELDGKIMENGRQFDVNLYRRPIGSVVTLKALRDGVERTHRVQVIERPGDFDHRLAEGVTPEENLVNRLGVLAVDLSREVAARLPAVRGRAGVVVVALSGDGSLGRDRLLPGDIIYSVNGATVSDVESLRSVVAGLGPNAPAVLQVQRRGGLRYIAVDVGSQ